MHLAMLDRFPEHIEPVLLDPTEFGGGALQIGPSHGLIELALRFAHQIESQQVLNRQVVAAFAHCLSKVWFEKALHFWRGAKISQRSPLVRRWTACSR